MNVTVAALALIVAVAFVSMPLVRHRYGAAAMAKAQRELSRQGVRTTALTEHGMRFDASGHESAAPIGIATVLMVIAGVNLAEPGWAGAVSVVVFALVLLGNSVIVYSNLTAVKSVRAAFARKKDPDLLRLDVPALLAAAESGFPAWTWTLQKLRNGAVFGAATLGIAITVLG
ncbi:hypothetical protein NLM24_00310 [Nocardia zapadnayensis]|nr:hypothetical protein [Nocardia zapadnayensis]MCX0269182.1 hypothetical protein [Nocardia zapadnayensis]